MKISGDNLHIRWLNAWESTVVAAILADDVISPMAEARRAWRMLALFLLLGLLSFAAVSDESTHRPECGVFTLDQSLVGGCDRLE
jgi:hypothetical protein